MLSKTLAGFLIATTMLAGPVLAQSSPSPDTNATPSVTQPSGAVAGPTVAGPGGVQFYTQTSGSADWRASKFMGVDIRGSDNDKIGDVKDLILDHNGMVQAVVIGVGGFLGLGEKDVAVPFKTIEWQQQPARMAATGNGTVNNTNGSMNNGTNAAAGANNGTANNGTAGMTGTAGNNSDVTGSVNTTGTNGRAVSQAYPDHGLLRMTKDELKNAPTYRYPDDTRAAQ